MATHRISLLNGATVPDTSGSVYAELSSTNLNSNDLTPTLVWVFADTSTDLDLRVCAQVPQNYVGTAKVVVIWATTATSGNVNWAFAYNSIADGESFDPSAVTETIDGGATAVPATARLLKYTSLSLTSSNLAAGDTLVGVIRRQGSDTTNDTLAASAYLVDAFLEYADA